MPTKKGLAFIRRIVEDAWNERERMNKDDLIDKIDTLLLILDQMEE